jgi:hypothetical protein
VERSKKQFLIMTAKEKAKELIEKMSSKNRKFNAISCALITADEAAKITGSRYWYDVQREIQKL